MKKTAATFGRIVVLGLFALGLAHTAQAQSGRKAVASPTQATAAEPAGAKQGIKVSGYWKIDVRNADGSLASHREFENALSNNELLPGLLLGVFTSGPPALSLTGEANSPCSASSAIPCVLLGNGTPAAYGCPNNGVCTHTLAGGFHFTNGKSDGYTLSGSFTATQASTIVYVSSSFFYCGPHQTINTDPSGNNYAQTSPSSCTTGSVAAPDQSYSSPFTRFTLQGDSGPASPMPVTAGQIVQVSVLFTFS